MDVPDEDVDTELLGAFAGVVGFGVGVLLDGEVTSKLGVVAVGDPGVDVGVGEIGGGEEGEDGGGDDGVGVDGVEVDGMGVDGWVGGREGGVEVEDGLRVVVVLDPPVILNCGLALPESPNTSEERSPREVRTRGGGCVNMTSGQLRRREKELRTDDDVVGPIRNVRDSDLHRACVEEEVLGERVNCEVQQQGVRECVSVKWSYVTPTSSRVKRARSTTERGVGRRGKRMVNSLMSRFSPSCVKNPSKS